MPLSDLEQVKALTFDVFGTCVDWRSSVEEVLRGRAAARMSSPEFASLPLELQHRARSIQDGGWSAFAQQWRDSYGRFTRGFVPGETAWKDIDAHHHDSLVQLLAQWRLDGLYTAEEVASLSRVWHALRPWSDSAEGIHKLGAGFTTSTLSNGNRELLRDLDGYGGLGFRQLLSAEDFRAYKPNPAVYLGACAHLGLEPRQVAMVAAHLGDLEAARSCGLRTVYVERKGEEEWVPGEGRYEEAKRWVDMWVGEGPGGFVEVARRLGIV